MALISRTILQILGGLTKRFTFRLSSSNIPALITLYGSIGEQVSASDIPEILQKSLEDGQIPKEQIVEALEKIWKTCQNSTEFTQKLLVLKKELLVEIDINILFDLAVIGLNVWDIMLTYDMFRNYAADIRAVETWIEESQIEWNLFHDKLYNWVTIDGLEKEKLKNSLLQEQVRIQAELAKVQIHQARLEEKQKFKWLLTGITAFSFVTGVGTYWNNWKVLTTGHQIFAATSSIGLGTCVLVQGVQLHTIYTHLSRVQTDVELLNSGWNLVKFDG